MRAEPTPPPLLSLSAALITLAVLVGTGVFVFFWLHLVMGVLRAISPVAPTNPKAG